MRINKFIENSTIQRYFTNIILVLILIASFGLNIYQNHADSFWMDETLMIERSRLPIADVVRLVKVNLISGKNDSWVIPQALMPIGVRIEKAVTFFVDYPSETLARLPFAFISTFGVFCIFVLVRRIFGNSAGLICALILSVNIYNIYFAQEARYYSVVLTAATALLMAELLIFERLTVWTFSLFFLACSIMPYTHAGVLPILVPIPFLFFCKVIVEFIGISKKKIRLFLKRWLIFIILGIIVAIISVPMLKCWWLISKNPVQSMSASDGVTMFNHFGIFLMRLFKELLTIMIYNSRVAYQGFNILIAFGLIGFIVVLYKKWFIALHFLLTLLILWYIGRSYTSPAKANARYFLYLLPFLILNIGVGVAWSVHQLSRLFTQIFKIIFRNLLKNKSNQIQKYSFFLLFGIVICVIVYQAIQVIPNYYKARPKVHTPVRDAVSYMLSSAPSNSILIAPVIDYGNRHTFKYYVKSLGNGQETICYFPWDLNKEFKTSGGKKYISWFFASKLNPNIIPDKEQFEFQSFRSITIVRTLHPINYSTCLNYSRILYEAALRDVRSKWHANTIEEISDKCDNRINIFENTIEKYSSGKQCLFSTEFEEKYFYLFPKNRHPQSCIISNSLDNGSMLFFNLKGESEIWAASKYINLKPGYYEIEGEAKLTHYEDYGLPFNKRHCGLHIDIEGMDVPAVQWYNINTNWINKFIPFVVEEPTKIRMRIGFDKTKGTFAKGVIRKIELNCYSNIVVKNNKKKSKNRLQLLQQSINSDKIITKQTNNLLKNSNFDDEFDSWYLWKAASKNTNSVIIKSCSKLNDISKILRIENPNAQLVGLKQYVTVSSGEVYRLSGYARSTITNNSEIIFGGRIAFWQKGRKENQIVWMSEYNQWWKKELVFTNNITGTAIVYVHMGYGNVASTGEFANVRLEKME